MLAFSFCPRGQVQNVERVFEQSRVKFTLQFSNNSRYFVTDVMMIQMFESKLLNSCVRVFVFRRQHPEHTLFRDVRDQDSTDESIRFSSVVFLSVSPCSHTGKLHSYSWCFTLHTHLLIQHLLIHLLPVLVPFFILPHQPDVHPGNCWAFKGSTGYLVIRLCVKIIPTAFSLEHIPKALSPTGNISSAPRNFTVYVRHTTDSRFSLFFHSYQDSFVSLLSKTSVFTLLWYFKVYMMTV